MAPTLLFDITDIDLDAVLHDAEAVERINPHRGEMRLIDAVSYVSEDQTCYAAYHDAHPDAFWVPGHIPGRPLMPGVLMVEAAAQLASYGTITQIPDVEFMGFARLDNVRFRSQVSPGQRLHLLLRLTELRRRRSIAEVQGLVEGTLTFAPETLLFVATAFALHLGAHYLYGELRKDA